MFQKKFFHIFRKNLELGNGQARILGCARRLLPKIGRGQTIRRTTRGVWAGATRALHLGGTFAQNGGSLPPKRGFSSATNSHVETGESLWPDWFCSKSAQNATALFYAEHSPQPSVLTFSWPWVCESWEGERSSVILGWTLRVFLCSPVRDPLALGRTGENHGPGWGWNRASTSLSPFGFSATPQNPRRM